MSPGPTASAAFPISSTTASDFAASDKSTVVEKPLLLAIDSMSFASNSQPANAPSHPP
jgi:hypothetical protein